MRSLLAGAALLATIASSATAQVTVTSQAGNPDPGPLAGQTNVVDFTGGVVPAGITVTGGAFKSASLNGQWAMPAGSLTPNGFYTTDGPYVTPDVIVMDFSTWLAGKTVLSLSLYWGSIDSYNTLEVLGTSDFVWKTIGGLDVANPANGNQTSQQTNRRVNLTFNSAVAADFRALRFTSTKPGFEFDDIALETVSAGTFTVTPEPTTIALVAFALSALGVVGARRKRITNSVV